MNLLFVFYLHRKNHTGYYPFDRIIRPSVRATPTTHNNSSPNQHHNDHRALAPPQTHNLSTPMPREVSLLRQRATRTSPMIIPHPHPRKHEYPQQQILFDIANGPLTQRGVPFRDLRPRSYFGPSSSMRSVEIVRGNEEATERFSTMKRPAFRLKIPVSASLLIHPSLCSLLFSYLLVAWL